MATLKYTCKTKTMSSQYNGELVEGMEMLLCSVGNAEARLAAITRLQATHERIVAHEIACAGGES